MGSLVLELKSMSARDLKDVCRFGKMDPYAVVYLSDDPENKQKTPVHQDGGRSPSWNSTMWFTINNAAALQPDKLIVAIKDERKFGADKDVGRVDVNLKELLDRISGSKDSSAPLTVTYPVKSGSSGKSTQGEFRMTCELVDNQSTGGWVSSAHGSFTGTPLLGWHGGAPSASVVGYPAQSYGIGVPVGYQGYHGPPQAGNAYGAYPPPGGYHACPPLGGYPPPGGYPAYPPPEGPTPAYPPPGGVLEALVMRVASTVVVDSVEDMIRNEFEQNS